MAEETGETAYISGRRDGEVVALATIEGTSAVRVGRIHSELRGNEHARASGKRPAEIRKRGYAVEQGESAPSS